jgi:ELWxxDGT repeat protein
MMVRRKAPPWSGYGPSAFGVGRHFQQRLYFAARIPHRHRVWRTDGHEGTTLVKDSGPAEEFHSAFCCANGKLFIFADDGVNGYELWVSDGTTTGTTLLKDIYPGPNGSWPSDLMSVGNLLLFVAEDGVNGRELWASDGTPGGTVMVKDIWPGANGSFIARPYVLGSTLCFSRSQRQRSRAGLWKAWHTRRHVVKISAGSCWSTPCTCLS